MRTDLGGALGECLMRREAEASVALSHDPDIQTRYLPDVDAILAMRPGLEMDMAVGRAMGKHVEEWRGKCYERREIQYSNYPHELADRGKRCYPGAFSENARREQRFKWRPSTDANDAVVLLPALLASGRWRVAYSGPNFIDCVVFVWEPTPAGNAIMVGGAVGGRRLSFCEAICKAFLIEFSGR